MLRHLRAALACLALVAAPALAAGCQSLGAVVSPSEIGCSEAEANTCRVVAAALQIKAANTIIGEQLDRRTITAPEAARLRDITRRAEDALAAARAALPLTDGSTDDKLAALDALLYQLLQEQLLRSGV